MTLLSIVVPSKNQAQFIPDFISGLKKQSFQDFEVIVVDDSDDNSVEILNTYKKITIIKRKSNANDAYLYAMDHAKGKYLMFGTTSDFIYSDRWLETAISRLESDESISLVWSSAVDIEEDGAFLGIWAPQLLKRPPPSKKKYLSYWFYNFYIPELNYCVNRNVYKLCLSNYYHELEKYNFTFLYSFLLNFTKKGYMMEYIPELGHAGRKHKNSVTTNDSVRISHELKTLKKLKLLYLLSLLTFRNTHVFLNSNSIIIDTLSGREVLILPIKILITFFKQYFYLILRKMSRI